MKFFFLALVLCTVVLALVLGGLVYLRSKEPRIWNDCLAVLKAPDDSTTASLPTAAQAPVQPPPPTPPAPTVPITKSIAVVPKEFTPPDPIPAQPNWTWNVLDKTYSNVVVTQVEADRVHITYDGGVGTVNTVDLAPDLQKLFNYDPELATQAAKAREDEEAKVDAKQAPIIAAQQAEADQQAAAEQAQDAQARQARKSQENVDVAEDQKRQYQDDMHQMEAAHQVTVAVNPQTGAVTYGGTTYWLDKYYADQRAVGQCDQVINSQGK